MPDAVQTPATTLTRGHKKKARTRRALIAAAIDVIADRGEAFTVSDVVGRAGVSNGTFYNYFVDRDALIDALVPEVLESFAVASAEGVTDNDPAVRFASITARILQRASVAPDEVSVVLRLDALQRMVLGRNSFAHLRADLAAGVESGRFEIASVDVMVDIVVGSLLVAARTLIDGGPDPRYQCNLIEQLLRSLGVAGDQASAIAARVVDEVDRSAVPAGGA